MYKVCFASRVGDDHPPLPNPSAMKLPAKVAQEEAALAGGGTYQWHIGGYLYLPYLVVCFTNLVEKYEESQNGSSFQVGLKMKNGLKPPLSLLSTYYQD